MCGRVRVWICCSMEKQIFIINDYEIYISYPLWIWLWIYLCLNKYLLTILIINNKMKYIKK